MKSMIIYYFQKKALLTSHTIVYVIATVFSSVNKAHLNIPKGT